MVRDLVHELYQNSLPNAATTRNMMLQVFEGLVKSHFDVIDEEDQELLTDWDNFIRVNVSSAFYKLCPNTVYPEQSLKVALASFYKPH